MDFSLQDPNARRRQPARPWLTPKLAHLAAGFLILLTTVAETTDGMVEGAPPPLLLPVESSLGALAASPLSAHGAPSVRQARINPAAVVSPEAWLQPGQQVRLDLLANQDITLAVEAVESTATGGRIIRGRAITDEASSVTLTLEGRSLTGFVRLTGLGAFRLAPTGSGEIVEVSQVKSGQHAFCSTFPQPVPPEASLYGIAAAGVARQATDLPPADSIQEPTVVDVMFLYTPQTVIGEGSEEGIRRRVLDAVGEMNFRLTNSLIHVRIHPVYIGLYNTFETGDLPRDNYRLANAVDGMERVPALRNDYKADLVCLVTEWENQGFGGQAWDLTPPKGNPATGFTVIRRPILGRGNMILAHEVGHLLGCAHDREHAGDLASEFYSARKPYIYGHRFAVEGVTYVDLMSYEPGIYVPYYSNPRLNFEGVPLGMAADQTLPSDGARTINETAPYVAAYRTALSRIEFAQARMVVAEQSGTATIQLIRTGDLNTSTRVSVVVETASSAKPGLDFVRPTSTLVDFGTNQATATLEIALLADQLAEGEETIRLSLSSVLGEHGIGRERTGEVVILDAGTPPAYSQLEFPEGLLSVPESADAARVRVRFTGSPVVLPYRTVDGTAVGGVDFESVSGLVTNAPGTGDWVLPIPLIARTEPGPDRVFTLIVGTRTNTIRILDGQRIGALLSIPGKELDADGNLNSRVRSDGKLLVWGSFSRLAGQERTGIALLNPDGTVDDSFRPPEILLGHRRIAGLGGGIASINSNAVISTVCVQDDGKLLLAGTFSRVAGQPRTTLIRLQSDGSLDEAFGRGLHFDGALSDVALQRDGKIVVGGSFERINGVRRPFIARLLPDGSVDDSFSPKGGPTSDWTVIVVSLALQVDGKILMGGYFQKVDGSPMLNLARLNPDGTRDTSFKLKGGASGPVWRIRVQPDGKIVVGGVFDTVGGRATKKLARLNADGSNDLTFRPPNPNADVNDFVGLPDGRLLVSGNFTTIAGKERRFLTLLQSDGTLDPGLDFGNGPDRFLGTQIGLGSEATPLLANGTLYLSGPFQRFNGMAAPNLVRLNLGESAPILRDTRLSSGELATSVIGLPGIYPVESSPDLDHWQPAGQVRLEGDGREAEVHVPAAPDSAQFIRLRTPTP